MKAIVSAEESRLNIAEKPDALEIRLEHTPSFLDRGLSSLAIVGFAIIAGKLYLDIKAALALAALAGIVSWLINSRMKTVTLMATEFEFKSVGGAGDGLSKLRRVATSSIVWLEYKPGISGPETSHEPEGLYAITSSGSVCLLPEIGHHQAMELLDAIERKFPRLGADWAKNIQAERKLTILDL